MAWKKGQSGNPGGKPSDKPLSDALRRKLYADDRKKLNDLADIWYARAMSGDMQALLGIRDTLEGKPLQQIEAHNVNENHYVRAPAKAAQDDWQKYLNSKNPEPKPAKTNGHTNGSSH